MNSRLTVTQAAATRDLADLSAIKAELNVTGNGDDAFLGQLISEASAAIETYCGRVFALQEYSEEFRLPTRDATLVLRQWPVTAVDSIDENGTDLTDETDFETDGESGRITRLAGSVPGKWPARVKVTVQYTAGYLLPGDSPGDDLPADIERACTELVKMRYFGRERDPNVTREVVPQVYDVTFGGAPGSAGSESMPAHVSAMLDSYRAPVFA